MPDTPAPASHVLPLVVVEPDPALALSIDEMAHDHPGRVATTAVADLEELPLYVQHTGLVVVGPSWSGRSEIEILRAFRDRHPAIRIVLAWNRRPGGSMKDVVAIGADALVDPDDVAQLRGAVLRGLDLAERVASGFGVELVEAPKPLGQVLTVASATGGCGKTFYATNLAFALNSLSDKTVCLLDLDLQFGEVMTALRLRSRHTMADVVAIADDEDLTTYLPEMVTHHESGIHVLPAPLDPAEADRIRPQDVTRVIDACRARYDYVIVDNPTGLGETTLAALDRSAHLFVMAALDLSSMRNLRLFLQTLDRLHIADHDVSLVLNKEQSGVGLDAEDVEQLFPMGFRSRIPFDRDVPRSMNAGVPVIEAYPTSPVSGEIVRSIVEFLPEEAQAAAREAAGHRRDRWYRRLFTRRVAEPVPTMPATVVEPA